MGHDVLQRIRVELLELDVGLEPIDVVRVNWHLELDIEVTLGWILLDHQTDDLKWAVFG